MAAGSTYTPIATQTLGSSASVITFTSIPSTYTDIIMIATGTTSAAAGVWFIVNNDSGSNYSLTQLQGDGTSATSSRVTGSVKGACGSWYTTQNNSIAHFQNYANTTTYKTVLNRMNNGSNLVEADVSLWRSTAAINRIDFFPTAGNTLSTGTTVTLYGILAA
jgi:hypothetical protein